MATSTAVHLMPQHRPYSVVGYTFSNYGAVEQYPVKVYLTEAEIRDYGQRLAKNIRTNVKEVQVPTRAMIDLLSEEKMSMESDATYYLDFLEGNDATPEHSRGYAESMERIKAIDEQIDSLKLRLKADVQAIQSENEILALAIRLGFEMRPVSCSWWVDWSLGRKDLVRIDTGELVLTQTLRDEERQLELLWGDIGEDQLAALHGEDVG